MYEHKTHTPLPQHRFIRRILLHLGAAIVLRQPEGAPLGSLVIGYLAIESFAQRRVETLLLRVTVLLAMVSAVLLGVLDRLTAGAHGKGRSDD